MIRAYERIAEKLHIGKTKAKPFGQFRGGRLMMGTLSLHRTKAGRLWRMFWRMKK